MNSQSYNVILNSRFQLLSLQCAKYQKYLLKATKIKIQILIKSLFVIMDLRLKTIALKNQCLKTFILQPNIIKTFGDTCRCVIMPSHSLGVILGLRYK